MRALSAGILPWIVSVSIAGCAVGVDPGLGADGGATLDSGLPSGDSSVADSARADTGGAKVDSGPCRLVINELQTGDGSGATVEFVELHNACGAPASLDGYKLVYRSASGTSDSGLFTFPAGTTLAANGYFVLGGAGFTGATEGKLASGLAAAGASLALLDATAAVVDSVAYGTGTGIYVEGTAASAPGDGTPAQALARKPNGVDTNDNAADFTVAAPTPGSAN